jgi:ABC-type lipoprotein release transport system permease subunit
MYLKLMTRGLLRYRKRGRRFFVLITLCSAALVFLLTFRSDFSRQNRDQFIGLHTGHLQILPPDSPLLTTSFTITERESVPLVRLDSSFDQWIRFLPEVEEAAPVITRYGMRYNLDSELESWMSLIALPAERKAALFPTASVTEGSGDIRWQGPGTDVPVLRDRLQTEWGDRNSPVDRFTKTELRDSGTELAGFLQRIAADFPETFIRAPYNPNTDLDAFLDDWKSAIADAELHNRIPEHFLAEYDWKIDDAISAAAEVAAAAEAAESDRVQFLNKRIFAALYPEDIVDLREPVTVGKKVSLQIAPFTTTGPATLPTVIPAVYVGMCEVNPLYVANSFLDIDAFRYAKNLGPTDATAWVVRLRDIRDTDTVRALIEEKLEAIGSDAKVLDYNKLGEIYLATGVGFSLVIGILVVIFVVILLIFTLNLVLMSMIQRRREIGTGMALGLDGMQTVIIMTGEVAVIVAVSCAAGSILGLLLVALASRFGIPGMVFFSGGKLKLTLQSLPVIQSWLFILPTSICMALVPLLPMRKMLPVDLLKEN